MRFLLDTSILVRVLDVGADRLPAGLRLLLDAEHEFHVSVATLWEIAIKSRLGKLPLPCGLADIPQLLADAGFVLVAISADHVLAELELVPGTKDPFDRLLLAQCQVEDLRLITSDRALVAHPLVWTERAD
jgi:PIN domain nuclease of toxin-antitoxin system